jgi:5-methyltetrahydrofolate--homocysteine methyltransferase
MLEDLESSLVNLDEKNVGRLVKKYLDQGVRAVEILKGLNRGMESVGQRFERGEYFLSDLIMAGEIMKQTMLQLNPHLTAEPSSVAGRVVMGTIQGDLHDIGKNIAKMLLESSGFQIYDLGIDVPVSEFVQKAKEVDAHVVGISALLSVTVPVSAEVVKLLRKEGLKTKVIVGGAATRKGHEKMFGVNAAVNDAVEGVRIIKSWMEKLS